MSRLGAQDDVPPPYALPALPANFVGRGEQLAWLQTAATTAAAGQPPVRVLGLSGPPGAGKTALAVTAAHQLAAAFPGAQFFIDLEDLGPDPAPADVMAQVIWCLDPDAVLPENPARLPEAYRSILNGRRVLLVIDGVPNQPSQPRWATLAPPEGCLLLVGGDAAPAGPGAGPAPRLPAQAELALEPVPEADAARLLRNLAPRIGPAAAQLAALCGRLPLALRLAAAALSPSSDLVTSSYLGRLLDEQVAARTVDVVQAALAVTVRLLPPEADRLWRQLSIFPAGFELPAAAAVAELQLAPARGALDLLQAAGLVERDRATGRYRLHRLIRQFAASRLEPSDRELGRQRHAAHYRDVLAEANLLAVEGENAGLLAGLRQFDLERANILGGQAWAAARASLNPAAARLASDYAASGARLLPVRQSPAARLAWLETARAAAQQVGDAAAEGSHLEALGRLHRRAANPRRAIAVYERRLRMARDSGDRKAEGEALGRLGLTYIELGEARRALEFSRQALDIARELDNRRDEALASWNMGLAYEELGDLPSAIAAMQVCVDFERDIEHPDAAADAAQVAALRRRAAA